MHTHRKVLTHASPGLQVLLQMQRSLHYDPRPEVTSPHGRVGASRLRTRPCAPPQPPALPCNPIRRVFSASQIGAARVGRCMAVLARMVRPLVACDGPHVSMRVHRSNAPTHAASTPPLVFLWPSDIHLAFARLSTGMCTPRSTSRSNDLGLCQPVKCVRICARSPQSNAPTLASPA